MTTITAKPLTYQVQLAIIVSDFNREITEKLLQGTLGRLRELDLPEMETIVWVPGAVEIPIMAQHLAKMESYDAIIALGAVIRGETDHYAYVCQQVSSGCQQVALAHHIPVIFGVLTTENEAQALDRAGGELGNKGKESADAALTMISLLRQLRRLA